MSRVSTLTTMLTLLLAIAAPAFWIQKETPREMAAIVSSLFGKASVVMPPKTVTMDVHLFDWLPAGCVVEVPKGSRLTLAFAGGSRYEMEGNSRAILSNAGPKSERGTIRPLEPFPPIPRLAFTAAGRPPGLRSGAVRVRGANPNRIGSLYPHANAATIPDSTILRFSPIAGGAPYRVVLANQAGSVIFETETQLAQVAVPAGKLQPATPYRWHVRTLGTNTPAASGEAEFVTLSADEIKLRHSFKTRMESEADAESLALLGEVDRRLGLLLEAEGEFQAALAKSPSNDTFRRILAEIRKELLFDWDEQ
jgi:hypothetical protein